ncbi:hypothetical protein AMTR_s00025p00133030 [Amborella trichopoda]|uniref:Uncharacterized protein n=1 Tax=Amborella trichopoda TaxID=13333 RepID=W1PX57_AMBTC|nr:hypothetical protein AMTR_s00025p00133030 [Amborella trichopoda]
MDFHVIPRHHIIRLEASDVNSEREESKRSAMIASRDGTDLSHITPGNYHAGLHVTLMRHVIHRMSHVLTSIAAMLDFHIIEMHIVIGLEANNIKAELVFSIH